jgi:hypothetical protein
MGLFTGSLQTDNFFSAKNPLILAAAKTDFCLVHSLKVHQQHLLHTSAHIWTSSTLDALSFLQLQTAHLTTPSRIPQVDSSAINASSNPVLVTSYEIAFTTIPHTHYTLSFSARFIKTDSNCTPSKLQLHL